MQQQSSRAGGSSRLTFCPATFGRLLVGMPWFRPDSRRSHCSDRPTKIFGSYQEIGNRTLPAVDPAEPCDLLDKPPPARSATAKMQQQICNP